MQLIWKHSFQAGLLTLGLILLLGSTAQAKKKRRVPKKIQVREITVDTRNVFDPTVPGEDIWLFRLANKLHITTRQSVVLREMLVKPGDWTDLERLEESERNLRALPFIKDAVVTAEPKADGRMDLRVKTQDSWTTQPQINIASEGGETTFAAGFEEINLLGYGKYFSYFFKNDVEGTKHVLGYNDPQFLNTRTRLNLSFEDTPTGDAETVDLSKPFYSLTTRRAGGLPFSHSSGVEKVFENGQQISQYETDHLSASPFVGWWLNNDPLNVLRLQANYRYSEDIYKAQTETLPETLPENKSLSGPIVGLSFIQSDFIKETFADRTGRVEDINLGHQSNLGVGFIGRKLGATENSLPFSLNDSFGFGGEGPWFGLFSYGTSSRYMLYSKGQTGGRLINTIYFGNFNYYRHLLEAFPMTGVIHIESAYLQRPETENLLTLGGDAGLRGFKVNSFTGNKSLLINLENRFYYPREVLHLAYMGGAVFVDVGQTQPQGRSFTQKDFHMNVGMGMRFGLTRSAAGTVFRVDLAYAVGPIQQSNRWILSISSAQGFKREGNTYKNFAAAKDTQ